MFTPVAYDAAATRRRTSPPRTGRPASHTSCSARRFRRDAGAGAVDRRRGAGRNDRGRRPGTRPRPECRRRRQRDPVNTENGDFTQSGTDLRIPTYGPAWTSPGPTTPIWRSSETRTGTPGRDGVRVDRQLGVVTDRGQRPCPAISTRWTALRAIWRGRVAGSRDGDPGGCRSTTGTSTSRTRPGTGSHGGRRRAAPARSGGSLDDRRRHLCGGRDGGTGRDDARSTAPARGHRRSTPRATCTSRTPVATYADRGDPGRPRDAVGRRR